MENKLYFIGKKREIFYWGIRLLSFLVAIILAFVSRLGSLDFWSGFYTIYEEVNIELSQAIITEQGLPAIIDMIRGNLAAFDICMIMVLLTLLLQYFYLRKRSLAFTTLYRLPKKEKVLFQLYGLPMLFLLLVFLVRLGFVCLLIWDVKAYAGSESLVLALYQNMWRMLL